jgi:phosphatidylserine decarboxylase
VKIAREGLPFVLPLVAIAVALGVFVHPWAGVAAAIPALFTVWFFRDPERAAPGDPGLLISPADGKILATGPDRVSIFMNVFNVHVCRTPRGGTVGEVTHTPGNFKAAYRDDASEHNERVSISIEGGAHEIRFTLVAGLIARRIVCRVGRGDRLRTGERVGLIRFGSRVDVDLPEGSKVAVTPGQTVVAGETPIARLPES